MSEIKGLFIVGFGGHARAVADTAMACGIESFIFLDSNACDGENFLGHPAQREWPIEMTHGWACFPAAGDNQARRQQIERIEALRWPIITLVAPTATIGLGASISTGTLVGQHAHIGPMATIGKGCIINTAAIVEHECTVADYVHISVNAVVAGRSSIGEYSFIGAGAIVIDGLTLCDRVTLGAGSLVIRNINEAGIYVGSPAIPLR